MANASSRPPIPATSNASDREAIIKRAIVTASAMATATGGDRGRRWAPGARAADCNRILTVLLRQRCRLAGTVARVRNRACLEENYTDELPAIPIWFRSFG